MNQTKASLLDFQPIVKQFEKDIQKLILLIGKQKRCLESYEFKGLTEITEQQSNVLLAIDESYQIIKEKKSKFLKFDLERIKELAQLLQELLQENLDLLDGAKGLHKMRFKIFNKVKAKKTSTYNANRYPQTKRYIPNLKESF